MQEFTFNHIAISVKDVAKSVNFYQKVFNLKEIENTASVSNTRWLMLTKTAQIHIIPRPDFEIKINKAVHFALATQYLNSFINHLDDLNCQRLVRNHSEDLLHKRAILKHVHLFSGLPASDLVFRL